MDGHEQDGLPLSERLYGAEEEARVVMDRTGQPLTWDEAFDIAKRWSTDPVDFDTPGVDGSGWTDYQAIRDHIVALRQREG